MKRRITDGVKKKVRSGIRVPVPKSVLVVQIRQVGDVLLTTPAVRALKEHFPGVEVDFLADRTSAQVLFNNPFIREVLVYDKKNPVANILKVRKKRYDWVVDFLGNPRSALLTFMSGAAVKAGFSHNWRSVLYNFKVEPFKGMRYVVDFKFDLLSSLGVNCYKREPGLFLGDEEREKIKAYLESLDIDDDDFKVCLSPTSRRQSRRWRARHYAKLGELLMNQYGARIFLLWGPGEEEQVEEVVRSAPGKFTVIPKFSLREMAALIEVSNLMVANSNGPMHIAEALRIPTIAVYGPNEPGSWSLPAQWSRWISAESVDCLGCGQNVCPRNMECMDQLTPDAVLKFFHGVFPNTAEVYHKG